MNLFGIGPLELLVVLTVALVVLGPARLASTGRQLGKMARDLRRATQELPAYLEEMAEGEGEKTAKQPKTPSPPPVPYVHRERGASPQPPIPSLPMGEGEAHGAADASADPPPEGAQR
jgi:Sec-independent protein translocase protein TatA